MATNSSAQLLAHAILFNAGTSLTLSPSGQLCSKLVGRRRNKVTPSININLPLPPTRA